MQNDYYQNTKLYQKKKITRLLPLALLLVLHTHNNTDGNKIITFSSTALYNGDNLLLGLVNLGIRTNTIITICIYHAIWTPGTNSTRI